MDVFTSVLTLTTGDGCTIQDLTAPIIELVSNTLVKRGYVLIFTKHTTTALKINENEARLLKDMQAHFDRMAPCHGKYLHDDIHLRDCPPDERPNGHSHLKAMTLNSSEFIPIIDGALALGKWQSILFLDFDGRRTREVIVQISGEK